MPTPLSLDHAILGTFIFFDLFSHPLTFEEVWEFLLFSQKNISIEHVRDRLEHSDFLAPYLFSSGCMYALVESEAHISRRLERYEIAESKYQIACSVARVLARIPFVRMTALVNTLAISAADQESDIDIFVVSERKHLWLVRLLCVAYLQLIRKRPTAKTKTDMICASFFASDDSLDFSSLQIPIDPQAGLGDLYLAWWVSRIVPIYDAGEYAKKFFDANGWASHVFPNRRVYHTSSLRTVRLGWGSRVLKICMEAFIALGRSLSEKLSRSIQMHSLSQNLRVLLNRDTRVVMNDRILKLHVRDTREELREQFIKKCASYGIHFSS